MGKEAPGRLLFPGRIRGTVRSYDDDEDEEEAPRPPKRPKVTATVGERFTGSIKSFHEGVGLGFIACKATYATFGRDVSLDRSELSGFEVGDSISFELAV